MLIDLKSSSVISIMKAMLRTCRSENWKQEDKGWIGTTCWALTGPGQQSCQEAVERGWSQSKVEAGDWCESRADHWGLRLRRDRRRKAFWMF